MLCGSLDGRGVWGRMKVKVTQLSPTVCDPLDCSQPGSSVHGILQARILEWVAIGGEWIHVYVWLSSFLVHLKLSQHS